MKEVKTLGIDLAKNIFQLYGCDERGNCILVKRLSRHRFTDFICKMKPCTIGMEACGGANFWARTFREHGHEVKLMAPQYVKPYVKTNKNDMADAEGIHEALTRPNMRFIGIKEKWQQDIQSLHRARTRLVRNKVGLSNEIRGLLLEYGVTIPLKIIKLKQQIPVLLEGENELSPLFKELLRELYEELQSVEKRIEFYDKKIEILHKGNETCQRLAKIEGVGPITSTAFVSAIGDPLVFKNGRQVSAWLGLVPRQSSSGEKERLLGISKRGDANLRTLLIHGSRTVLRHVGDKTDPKSLWIKKLLEKRGYNRTCVALANKNARTMWALLAKKEEYRA